MKKLEDFDFNELVDWAHNDHMSELFRAGGAAARTRMHTLIWCAIDWEKKQIEKDSKKKSKK